MSRHLYLLCGLLLQGCCLFGTADESIGVPEAGRAQAGVTGADQPPSLTGEAARAVAVATEFVEACRRGDSARVRELTDPGQREFGFDKSLEMVIRGIGGDLGAEIEGDWAIVGFGCDHEDMPGLLMFIMHRSEGQWYVGCPFVQNLTEVFSSFRDYPAPPSDKLKYRPARRFKSLSWSRESSIPTVRLGDSAAIPIDGTEGKNWTVLKFSVKDPVLIRIFATTAEDAFPALAVLSPEGGSRTSADQGKWSKHDRYSQGPREALIEHGMWDGTYLLVVTAGRSATVRLRIESLPLPPAEK